MSNNYIDLNKVMLQSLKGVGPRRAEQLARLKLFSVQDLLYYFPREYIDRSNFDSLVGKQPGEVVNLVARVLTVQEKKTSKNLVLIKAALACDRQVIYGVWFNQAHLKKLLCKDMYIYLCGKLNIKYGQFEVQVQDYELLNESGDTGKSLNAGRIVPVYPSTAGLYQRVLRLYIKEALDRWVAGMSEFLPKDVLDQEELPEITWALQQVHYPESISLAQKARKRFIFEELFLFQLQLAMLRSNNIREEKPHSYTIENRFRQAYLKNLNFSLTPAQNRVVDEISADLYAPYPMNRLLQGDVGAGKTVVAILTLLQAVESGLQGALMAPTEVLAEQHYLALHSSLTPLGLQTFLLSGGMPAGERKVILEQIASGVAAIVVGTQALLQEDVLFKNLATVVIDEQHRFGVRQRSLLQKKGISPDLLIMTATPIPRTLTMTVYGDLDVSVIDSLPPGRQPVRTYYVAPEELTRVFVFVAEQVRLGKQAYIVCPLVEESEKLDLQAATDLYQKLRLGVFKEYRTELLHGRMQRRDKEYVMERFRTGAVDILVSTTVIEVGIDVPNANVMVIVDAERFGLAQLHQLRGRVGRGKDQAHCILSARLRTKESADRIRAMKTSLDGFYLAEKDLQIRGPGDMAGVRQSGMPLFHWADLLRDRDILKQARRRAKELIADDPDLNKEEHLLLRQVVERQRRQNGDYYHIG